MILAFDTETTGKADFKAHLDDPSQPRLVQLGAILADDQGKEISSINLIIKPEGYSIPEEASAVHGITTAMALKYGVPIVRALSIFHNLASSAQGFVAHNIEFDLFIVRGEFMRNGFKTMPFRDGHKFFCTMKGMMDFCQLPGGYNGEFKWTKLQEAYEHAFNKPLMGGHDAMVDVRAALELHRWIEIRMG